MVYTIELLGHVPAKKNEKIPIKTNTGKRRMIYSKEVQTEIDRLSMQVPGEVRDLRLVHPEIDFYFTVTSGASDTDNAVTTLLDILVTMGVLVNDSVAMCNGKKTIHSAVRGDCTKVIIKLTENEDGWDLWPDKSTKAGKSRRRP